jgi:hypothetical protein
MSKKLLRRPSPAMIIAIVALIAALAGTAVAGGPFLPKRKFSNFKKNVAVKGPITYVNQTQNVNNNNSPPPPTGVNITAACPTGMFPVGGGAKTSSSSQQSTFSAEDSYPSSGNGWTAKVFAGEQPSGNAESVTVTAICERGKASGTPPSITP